MSTRDHPKHDLPRDPAAGANANEPLTGEDLPLERDPNRPAATMTLDVESTEYNDRPADPVPDSPPVLTAPDPDPGRPIPTDEANQAGAGTDTREATQ